MAGLRGSKTTPITPQQLEVGRHLALGYTTKEVAAIMDISAKTVDVHKGLLYSKIGATNLVQLTHWAIRAGVIDICRK